MVESCDLDGKMFDDRRVNLHIFLGPGMMKWQNVGGVFSSPKPEILLEHVMGRHEIVQFRGTVILNTEKH